MFRRFIGQAMLVAILTVSLGAQRTWVVNDLPGSGADFQRVPDAVSAAQPGDTILIDPGSGGVYEFPDYLDKPLHIRGLGQEPIPYYSGVVVQGIGQGEVVVLENLEGSSMSSRIRGYLRILNCDGSVIVSRFRKWGGWREHHAPGRAVSVGRRS